MAAISVIIPVYNKKRYLKTLWKNLMQQSFSDFECLLIDDGSTDNSGKACDEIAMSDSRFKVYHISNGGVSNARNVGLDNAKGEYITFIDADDQVHMDYLKNLYECITANHVEFVIGSGQRIWSDCERTEVIHVPYFGIKRVDEFMPEFEKNQLSTGIYGYCWSKIMKRTLIGTHRFTSGIVLAEDLEFYLGLYPKIKKIYFDDKPYYYYLQAAENSSVKKNDYEIDYFEQLKIQKKAYTMLLDMQYLKGENKRLLESKICDYIFFTLFYAPRDEVEKNCDAIRGLNLKLMVDYNQRSKRKKIVLKFFAKGKDKDLVRFLKVYRWVRGVSY